MENSERDRNTRPPDLPLEKFVCRSGSNSQNWTGNNTLSCCDVVIVSNTSRFKKDVDDYIAIANECGANYLVTRLTGKFKNVHDVPEDTVKQMEDTLEPYPGEEVRCPG